MAIDRDVFEGLCHGDDAHVWLRVDGGHQATLDQQVIVRDQHANVRGSHDSTTREAWLCFGDERERALWILDENLVQCRIVDTGLS
jgi:hypothetical protein